MHSSSRTAFPQSTDYRTRQSWDTNVKHYFRLGLEGSLPDALRKNVPSSNISRWKKEPEHKYLGCEVSEFIKKDIELIKRFNQSQRIKKITKCYFKLCDVLHHCILSSQNLKLDLKAHKETIVNTIESVRDHVPVGDALKVFNISRATYQNYKSMVLHKCEASY